MVVPQKSTDWRATRARVGTIYYFIDIYNYKYQAKPANEGVLRWENRKALSYTCRRVGGEKG